MPELVIRTSGVLAAPRDLVWSQLVDRDAVSTWLDGIDAGPTSSVAAGDRGGAGAPPIEGTVLESERERRLLLSLRGRWRLLQQIDLDLLLSPDDAGTRVCVVVTCRPSWLGHVLRPLVRLHVEIALRRASRGFRASVEDAVARRRHARVERPDRRRATSSAGASAHDPLLLPTVVD